MCFMITFFKKIYIKKILNEWSDCVKKDFRNFDGDRIKKIKEDFLKNFPEKRTELTPFLKSTQVIVRKNPANRSNKKRDIYIDLLGQLVLLILLLIFY